MFKYFRLVLISLLILLFVLSACDYADDDPTSVNPERVVYNLPILDIQGTASGNGITITFEKTADWDAGNEDRGFTANITILNQTGNTLNDWDLNFDFLVEITSVWNASYTQVDNTFVILPANWNSSISDGSSRNFGFNGVYSGVFQEPTVYVLSGVPVGDQTPPAPIIPACTLNTVFNVASHWSTGTDTYGFVANMHLTNIGSEAVNWELDFDLEADIGNMWNASFQNEDDHYVITPDSWNVRIEPNQTRSFGFQGNYVGSLQPEPQNIVCNKDDDGVVESQLEIVSQHILAEEAELGQVNVSQGSRADWHSITTLQTYVDPVVIMQPLSFNDPEPATVRLKEVGPQGFEFQIQEWDYLDGVHPLETVNYLVVEKGLHTLTSGADNLIIEAGTIETDDQYKNVFLTWTYSELPSPIIFSQAQTINNPIPITVRQKLEYNQGEPSPRKVGFKVQEQEVNGQAHNTETIGYVILQENEKSITTITNYTNYYIATSPDGVDHTWHNFTFPASLVALPDIEPTPTLVSQTPYFFANMQSDNENDSSTLRYRQLNTEGVEILVEEEQSQDSERAHTAEVVGFAVFMGIQPVAGQDTPVSIAHQHLVENGLEDVDSLIYKTSEGEYEGQEAWSVYIERDYVPVQINEDGGLSGGAALGGEIIIIIAKNTGEVLKRTHFQ